MSAPTRKKKAGYFNPQGKPSEVIDRKRKDQLALFESDDIEETLKEWVGMPEYEQNNLMPWKTVYVHFANQEALFRFAELVGQKLTLESKSIWFPKAEIADVVDKRYKSDFPKQVVPRRVFKVLPKFIEDKVIAYNPCGDMV